MENANKDTQSRKWQLTINNPEKYGYSHEFIRELLSSFKSLAYWCMADEIGVEETYHTHLYMACNSAVRFSTLKKRFPSVHIEMARGTSQENRDYIFKTGKWEKDKKKETNLPKTHEEYGQIPLERQGARNDLNDLYDQIKSGMTIEEIIEDSPQHMMKIAQLEKVHQTLLYKKFKNTFRELEITYVYGDTGKGKTRHIMERYGYENVYRVSSYDHPFDTYNGQDVIIFEEFRSSLKVQDMLNYLDGYPLWLPCRYNNKLACYTKVYLVTNITLNKQYVNVQKDQCETWEAFERRINKIVQYKGNEILERSVGDEFFNSL